MNTQAYISPITEIIEEARNGRMYILVDDENRENEGDLIIPAQMATPDAVNFMAKHGRGLICLALTRQRVDALGLNQMSRSNGTLHETAFTVSIEARHGVSTGISAADRARTIVTAVNGVNGAADIVSPGHVFPLAARDGGVLVRAGHTEAAVDVSRLAGLNPSGVICEIMNEDGSMARMADLVKFAQHHDLKIGTIRDLIAYRLRHDYLVERVGESSFQDSRGGEWRAITHRNRATGRDTMTLLKGDAGAAVLPTLRIHKLDIFYDAVGVDDARSGLLQEAMRVVGEAGVGAIILSPGSSQNHHFGLVAANDSNANREASAGKSDDFRNEGQILAELGIDDVILLTDPSHATAKALSELGINISREQRLPVGTAEPSGRPALTVVRALSQ